MLIWKPESLVKSTENNLSAGINFLLKTYLPTLQIIDETSFIITYSFKDFKNLTN